MSLPKKINVFLVFILSFACNMVCGQESDLKNPESWMGERIGFIQTSFDRGQTRIEADLKDSESNIKERIDFIQASFDKGQARASLWFYGWSGIYGTAAGVQTYQAVRHGHNRVSNIVGASESFLGLAVMTVYPFYANSSGSNLRKLPESTPEELKTKLDKAENWLEKSYQQEKLGRSWLTHVGVLAVSIIGAGIVWHYDGSKNGIISALTSVAGGEALIWTQPTKSIRDYNDYRRKYKDPYNGIIEKKYFVAPSPNGFVVGVYF
jgi:hypothetical protein